MELAQLLRTRLFQRLDSQAMRIKSWALTNRHTFIGINCAVDSCVEFYIH